MIVDADKKGMLITVGEDKRVTGIGKFSSVAEAAEKMVKITKVYFPR